MTRRQRRRFRRALLAFVLLILAAIVLACTAHAQERAWTYRVWDNGDVPLTAPRIVAVWGLAELKEALEAVPPTHGTVSFYPDGPCWHVSVTSGVRVWRWEDISGCFNYRFPMVGISGR